MLIISKTDCIIANRRLGKLRSRGKTSGLKQTEPFELMALIHLCQIGQIRKSEGLAESCAPGSDGAAVVMAG